MNILLTNDDGIDSEGLQTLAKVLRSRGKYRVFVIAPDVNRSGVSHGLTILNAPVKLTPMGNNSWSCSGNPADCVIAGVMGALPEKPDMVLSGINRGANLGTDIVYSGTAAAARQAALSGVPGIALSLAGKSTCNWDMAALWAADHLEELAGYWKPGAFVNVNIPNSPGGPDGMAAARPAIKRYNDSLKIITLSSGSRFCFLEPGRETADADEISDWELVSRNFVSVSTLYNLPGVYEKKD